MDIDQDLPFSRSILVQSPQRSPQISITVSLLCGEGKTVVAMSEFDLVRWSYRADITRLVQTSVSWARAVQLGLSVVAQLQHRDKTAA